MKSLPKTAFWMAFALGAQVAMAETMMCGDSLIDDEQRVPVTKGQVLAACGEPTYKEFTQWVYEQPGQFPKVLRFDTDGNLQSISESQQP